jgi:competence protein CoiA
MSLVPLTAVHAEAGLLDATADDLGASVSWEDIHKVRPPAPLTCRACRAPMTARVSSRGLRHFAHRAAALDCPTLGETIHHHLLKIELAAAIRAAGWHAELEVPGNGWRADVLATSPDGSRRVAWEAQLASATVADLAERTATMIADGVEVCWVTDKDTTWVTHIPSVRIQWPEADTTHALAPNGRPALVVTDGHARFEPDWCEDRAKCEDSYPHLPSPCPGHGSWRPAQPLTLTTFVTCVLHDQVRSYQSQQQFWTRKSRHDGGTVLWVTPQYRRDAEAQRQASEIHERERAARDAEEARRRSEHHRNSQALAARQQALLRPTVEWVFATTGTYPDVQDHTREERFAMGVPVFLGEKLHALICPVAARITTKLAGWYSTATIVVASDAERARIAKQTRRGQRFHLIDPGPLPEPVPLPELRPASMSLQQAVASMFMTY